MMLNALEKVKIMTFTVLADDGILSSKAELVNKLKGILPESN